MSPLGRRPPNTEMPPEIICKWCGTTRKRHCKNKKCGWYPCKPCQVVTVYDRLHRNDSGGWAWTVSWRKVAKSWFV